jgi:quinol monooxygenase YgiN
MMYMKMIQSAAILSAVCFFGANAPSMWAQDNGTDGPPKILVVQRELIKPGTAGAMHVKSEAAFLQAMANAKATPRYLALTSLSGVSRALFFSGYSSMDAWEQESKSVNMNVALSTALDRANVADGDLLTEFAQSVWLRRDELSMNMGNLGGDRYMEITQFMVRPGHKQQWDELVKLVMAGYKKGLPDASWAMFQQLYGTNSNAFLVIGKLKSMSEVDQHLGTQKQFADAMGEDGMKKLEELESECVESEQTNLFAFNPNMSYPPEAWTKAEPDYWKQPKASTAKNVGQ